MCFSGDQNSKYRGCALCFVCEFKECGAKLSGLSRNPYWCVLEIRPGRVAAGPSASADAPHYVRIPARERILAAPMSISNKLDVRPLIR